MSKYFSWYSGSSTNRSDRHDITEIFLKVALNTITLNPCVNKSFLPHNELHSDIDDDSH